MIRWTGLAPGGCTGDEAVFNSWRRTIHLNVQRVLERLERQVAAQGKNLYSTQTKIVCLKLDEHHLIGAIAIHTTKLDQHHCIHRVICEEVAPLPSHVSHETKQHVTKLRGRVSCQPGSARSGTPSENGVTRTIQRYLVPPPPPTPARAATPPARSRRQRSRGRDTGEETVLNS